MDLYRRCDCTEACQHPHWYRFKHKGKEYRRSTRTANSKLALRIAERERNKVIGERAGLEMEDKEAPIQPLLSDAREQYLTWAKGDHPSTAESEDRRVLTVFQEILGDKRLDEYVAFDIERWRSARLDQGVVRNTVIRNEITLHGFFAKAKVWHGLKTSPFDDGKVTAWKPDQVTRETLTKAQLYTAFSQFPEFYALVCRVTYETAARLDEVLSLKRTALGASQLQFIRKGGRQDTVSASGSLLAALRAYCPLNRKYVFPNPETSVDAPMDPDLCSANMTRLWRAAGLGDFSHHCIRHTAITEMLERGVNPRTIQQYAGWTSLRQLARYGHARDAEARRAVEGQAAAFEQMMAEKPEAPQPEAADKTGTQ